MTKDDYINKIICEHWFCLISWKGKNWNDSKKQIWLSGMHRAWNTLFPSDMIGPLEIIRKASTWTRAEAEQWYADYQSQKEEDEGCIQSRSEILDL